MSPIRPSAAFSPAAILTAGTEILNGRYQLLEAINEGDPAAGLPAMWRVSDGASLSFAKVWQDDPDFPEVRAIWTHEVRSLLRLGGLPAADETFVRLRELGQDPAGFVVVLDGEGREPLSSVLAVRARHPWLSDLRSARTRRRLWQGLLKVGRGLAMMHAEGTLHRMLGTSSVFTDLDGSCDMRLSGFEWSLRVAHSVESVDVSSPGRPLPPPELSSPASQYSVASDWFSFGLLCAEVVAGVLPGEAGDDRLNALGKAIGKAGLTPAERRLVMDLVDPDPDRRMWQASEVTDAIEEVVEGLAGDPRERSAPLYVGFDLGRDTLLARRISQVSGGVDMRDPEARLAFVREDLGSEPQVSARLRPFPHYVLHGARIDYLLTKWSVGPTASWKFAACMKPDHLATTPPSRTYKFHKRRIEPRLSGWLAVNAASARAQAESWDEALPIEIDRRALSDEQAGTIGFLHVTNQIEALLTVTQIWPVLVVGSGPYGEHGFVDVTPLPDGERDELANLLGVPTPAEQMRRLFQADDVVGGRSAEQQFVFGVEGRLVRRDQNLTEPWTFLGHRHHRDGPRYRFWQSDAKGDAPRGATFLRARDLAGSSVLLHRRKKAIDDLRAHRVILDALNDPASVRRTTVGSPRQCEAVASLDPSKRAALDEIWRSQPLYILQGPPGTGKTTLVATLAAEQVATSDSTQLLITAQSHSVVDNVADEVMAAFGLGIDPLVIRLDADKDAVRRKDLGRRAVAKRLATALAESTLAATAPTQIRDRLHALCADEGAPGAAERGDFERLVESGAAVVFGTSNSGELADLLASGRRYDWSIVEEAGRAHGFDLALPLQASHRNLLIGDHQQLPPYGVATIEALLSKPDDAARALGYGARFAPTLVERHSWADVAADPEGFADDCSRWVRSLRLFRTLFERCERAGEEDGGRIARQLVHQHRMHPDIRQIVSDCFYPELTEAARALKAFSTTPDPFVTVEGGWLPTERIVFLDVPWVQRGHEARGEENKPPYTAPLEVDLVLRVLGQLRVAPAYPAGNGVPSVPTIQVLSPYRAQVKAIRKAVRRMRADDALDGLDGFEVRGADWDDVGATVDEFQGNQADIVVVSLVRNNHAKVGTGVGFLKEGPRWNVLLSRAKRKLVLVGCWDFLWSRFPERTNLSDDDPMADLAKVMHSLKRAVDDGRARRLRLDELPLVPRGGSTPRRRRRRMRAP